MSELGVIAIIFGVFFLGTITRCTMDQVDCRHGAPQVIGGKVYRCVEIKEKGNG